MGCQASKEQIITAQKQAVEAIQGKIKETEEKIARVSKEKSDLDELLQKTKNELSSKEKDYLMRIENLELSNQNNEKANQSIHSQLEKEKEISENLRKEDLEKSAKIKSFSEEIEKLNIELKVKEGRNEESIMLLKDKEEIIKRNEERLSIGDRTITQLKNEINEKEEMLRSSLKAKEELYREKEEELADLKNISDCLKDDLEKAIKELKEAVEERDKKIRELEEEIHDIKNDSDDFKGKLEGNIKDLERDLEDRENQIQDLQDEIDQYISNHDQAKTDLEGVIQNLIREGEDKEETIKDLKAQIEDFEINYNRTKDNLEGDIKKISEIAEEKSETINKLETEVGKLKKKVEKLEEENSFEYKKKELSLVPNQAFNRFSLFSSSREDEKNRLKFSLTEPKVIYFYAEDSVFSTPYNHFLSPSFQIKNETYPLPCTSNTGHVYQFSPSAIFKYYSMFKSFQPTCGSCGKSNFFQFWACKNCESVICFNCKSLSFRCPAEHEFKLNYTLTEFNCTACKELKTSISASCPDCRIQLCGFCSLLQTRPKVLCPNSHKLSTRRSSLKCMVRAQENSDFSCECFCVCRECFSYLSSEPAYHPLMVCVKGHDLHVDSQKRKCLNCNEDEKHVFYCKICDIFVCDGCCEAFVRNIYNENYCERQHRMAWDRECEDMCFRCNGRVNGMGKFVCEICEISYCCEDIPVKL